MKRTAYSAPEEFALQPLLSILPSVGNISKLQALTSSFYARYLKVSEQIKLSQEAKLKNSLVLESLMLKQVLDWLEVVPEEG